MNSKLLFLAVVAVSSLARAEDIRQQPPKDLNGYFPFNPPSSLSEWDARREVVRRQILVAEGLWPMPTKTPLNAVVHGKVEGDGFTVEKVYFESAPGFFVTGSLWKPKEIKGKVPGVMFAHGHWKDARLSQETEAKVRGEIAAGGERFERGGKSIFQSLCVQLARMGCVVWQWDMLSDSDSVQIPREVVHTFGKQRPEMNTAENWGLYSPQAEAHLQSIMALQTWNAVRGLDFLLSLPEVDPERTAITGASGGGTQTMLLAAIDDRIKLSFPCVMVSTAMQGGCTCENTSLLRINTGNVEFAGLFAPKPQGMNTANDWTKEMATKGFPDLQKLYTTFGKKDNVFLLRGEHFPHNYNAVTRSAFYTFLNKHFKLGQTSPVIEQDYEPLSREQLSVWDDKHPAPKAADPEFERKLLAYLASDAEKQLSKAEPKVLREGVEVVLGRTYDKAGEVEWTLKDKQDRGGHLEMTGTLTNKTYSEELNVAWLYPKQWNGRVVIWLDDAGKPGLANDDVKKLVAGGAAVLGVDLLFQGSEEGKQNRVVKNPREFAGYTYGYNHALFAQRVHDVLTLTTFLRNTKVGTHPSPKSVCVAAFGPQTGPIAVAARALAGEAIDRAAVDTHGFRFGKVLDYRDPMFLPGGAKYQDVPGMISLQGTQAKWVKGEGKAPEGDPVKWLME
ncbi:alpha/beta hydrolase family protein [Prosthecobacter sp.]|uniref:alpha/beta hydrolase family protein n=1 Tax=Prosthecobacter sp. TaxID=1965333 RepID=UPI003782FDCB